MQKGIRFNETQLQYLAAKSRRENTISGYLHKRSSDTGKWQLRYFVLYQNLLFHFESESAQKLSGATLLEGSYCERVLNPAALKAVKDTEKQSLPKHWAGIFHKLEYCFTITYKSQKNEVTRQIDFRTDTEAECNAWIDHIKRAPYSKVLEQREELEQKHLHLLQILDSERQAKWHYVQQTEELATSVKELRTELQKYKKERFSTHKVEEETDEIKKIKKVQSFFRGWLCRRRWKQIVELYIRSPHAESMRKRNSIVFSMVECEEEYNRQLSTLVTCFLRPLRMAASSKKPPISHEDVNSIFLNSETLLFLHQIFLKGLCARLENWPTLVLGDLFDMLLPMLCIYQEYVRNHHYSLQVLAEYKQRPEFNLLLKRYEEKPMCETRTLEIFLTYPMHQIPRYIITLHELLAHTPHDHVERKSLEFAKSKLEELSRIMHDEVSETENIRKNLSIERMIIEGCDILLDVNQTFVRQGPLIQVFNEKSKSSWSRIKDRREKEVICQVFLFTNHMLLTTRASNGRLHLAKILPKRQHYGKIPLIDCTLIEDPGAEPFINDPDTSSLDSIESIRSTGSVNTLIQPSEKETRTDYNGLDFKIIVDSKSGNGTTITLVAATRQEKLAWCSDISQCIEDIHYSDLLNTSMSESSSVTMPQSVRYIHSTQIWSDRRLFLDDVDIKFSRTLNSCKVPQIRHASVERLLDRLTDLRFLSIDFLNTFLLTYRVFTDGKTVLEALKRVYKNPESGNLESSLSSCQSQSETNLYGEGSPPQDISGELPKNISHLVKPSPENRRISTGCMTIYESRLPKLTQESFAESEEESSGDTGESDDGPDTSGLVLPGVTTLTPLGIPGVTTLAPLAISENLSEHDIQGIILPDSLHGESSADNFDELYKPETPIAATSVSSSSSYTLKSTTSSDTLTPRTSPKPSPRISPRVVVNDQSSQTNGVRTPSPRPSIKIGFSGESLLESLSQIVSPTSPKSISSKPIRIPSPSSRSGPTSPTFNLPSSPLHGRMSPLLRHTPRSPSLSPKHPRRMPSPMSPSMSSPNIMTPHKIKQPFLGTRGSLEAESLITNTRSSSLVSQIEGSPPSAKAGVVVSSHRKSKRRSSSSAAVAAFAAATAGSVNSQDQQPAQGRLQQVSVATNSQQTAQQKHSQSSPRFLTSEQSSRVGKKRESVISTAATMRVLNIIKHWVSKHQQDFECDKELKAAVVDMLQEMACNTMLNPAEHKVALSLLRTIAKDSAEQKHKVDLEKLLQAPEVSTKENFDTLSAMDIAEQLTYLDHKIFISIRSEELLGQAWMKGEKSTKAPHVLLVSKRFNEVSRMVVSEIVKRSVLHERVACIEKWAAIADICRCMNNYNGVLQICAAFVNSSVYRMKKTWEKIPKSTKQTIEKLQDLVSSNGRFKNMRDALHRCDPPCIPYLGMYLTDLSIIEEGIPGNTDEGLVNFSKMRTIAHVIREIRLFQQTPYKIEHIPRVTNYLLDTNRLLDDDQTYRASLEIEPKQSRLSNVSLNPS
ncbi:ras-specific guanine nucleotide-releasing factor 2-like isoform X4 [Ostrea edulis]|uniref:ras-specific guanine nucleotide-releasing factor 2-like isoform X4 n=1 Tax=Ostrea edulis TaxID=37623 RepID=UPI0020942873|nr:ras-specific guanine nucleotide-releasing factor 2-like isoform X4 [Ostrea edulis]